MTNISYWHLYHRVVTSTPMILTGTCKDHQWSGFLYQDHYFCNIISDGFGNKLYCLFMSGMGFGCHNLENNDRFSYQWLWDSTLFWWYHVDISLSLQFVYVAFASLLRMVSRLRYYIHSALCRSQPWRDCMFVCIYFDLALDLCQLKWVSLSYSDLSVCT